MNKLYDQILSGMDEHDLNQSFSGCYAYDKEGKDVFVIDEFCDGEAMTTQGRVDTGHLFGGRYEVFPPEERCVFIGPDRLVLSVSKTPMRHWKKGMYPQHYNFDQVGDLRRVAVPPFARIARALFSEPDYLSLERGVAAVAEGEVVSSLVGRWWSVAFSRKHDGLCLYYKTSPVVLFDDDSIEGEFVSENVALNGAARKQFPHNNWRI